MFANDSDSRRLTERASALLLLFVFLAIAVSLELRTEADDRWFLHALDKRGLGEFLISRYKEWSGRTLLEALLAGTIRYDLVWKLGIPACFIGSASCIWSLSLSRRIPVMSGTLLVTLLMLSISSDVLTDGGWWVTGFYNYLLPTTMGLFAFSILLHKRYSLPAMATGLLATLICCQQEQAAITLLAAITILICTRSRSGTPVRREIAFLVMGLASAALMFTAPGNYRRRMQELRWFPEYQDLGLIEKLGTGLDRINAHLHSPENLLIVIVAIIALFATSKSLNRHWAKLPLCGALALFIANALLMRSGLHDYPKYLGMSDYLAPSNWSRSGIYISCFLTIGFHGVLLSSAVYRAKKWEDALIGAGVPLLSLMLVMAVSFSPTIYASGSRILYISDLLLVLHACLILRDQCSLSTDRHTACSPA